MREAPLPTFKIAPLEITKRATTELFTDTMKVHRVENAHRILVYLITRPDRDIKAPHIEALLRSVRRVKASHLNVFYMQFSNLIRELERALNYEESCTMSGAYRKDLDFSMEKLVRIIEQFENEPDLRTLRYLSGLID